MPNQLIYFKEADLLLSIKNEVSRIGHGANISAWVNEACREKMNNHKTDASRIINKLKSWQNSFPRKNINEFIFELEEEFLEKI